MKPMKSTRKVIITILILVFACMFFVACNEKEENVGGRKPWAQPDPNNYYDVSQNYDYSKNDFPGEYVPVVLTNSESMNNLFYDYKIEDFGTNEDFCKIEEPDPFGWLVRIRKQIENSIPFSIDNIETVDPKGYTRMLKLYLTNPGKDNALRYINELNQKYYVLLAGTDGKGGGEWFATTSNDPYTSSQWGLEKIKAYDAWDIEKGNSTLTVGNIDSGINQTHEDLMGNMSNLSCGTDPYTDSVNHGTRTAGIIGAVGNNGKGISGVCWNIKIASLKACIGASDEDMQLVIAAIEYAKANDIKLLNFSGGFYSGRNDHDTNAIALKNAIASYNGLIVVAAGNHNFEIVDENSNGVKLYPQSFNLDNIIVVGASNINDERWISSQLEASNYSSTIVDLFAPGVNIYSLSADLEQAYEYRTGTSLAAPFVTGVAALIWSVEPNLTATQVKNRIMQNVDPIPALSNMCVSGGRLNAQKALEAHTHNKNTCTYTNLGVKRGHTIECRYCDYTETDAHTWSPVKVPNTGIVKHHICIFCGAITDIIAIPNPTSLLTPNALALMNEKESSTSGDYEFEITQDIVFVKKNGKYYLMVACDENGNIIADLSKVLKKEEVI